MVKGRFPPISLLFENSMCLFIPRNRTNNWKKWKKQKPHTENLQKSVETRHLFTFKSVLMTSHTKIMKIILLTESNAEEKSLGAASSGCVSPNSLFTIN